MEINDRISTQFVAVMVNERNTDPPQQSMEKQEMPEFFARADSMMDSIEDQIHTINIQLDRVKL